MAKAPSLCLAVAVLLTPSRVGAQTFEEVSRDSGIEHYCLDSHRICGGAAFFDYDNDGDLDLYLVGGLKSDRLYRNRGDGKFDDVSEEAGLGFTDGIVTVGVVTGDIDNDGYREIFVTTGEDERNLLLKNDGQGTFTDIAESAGITQAVWSAGATFGDYNLDGLLDLYVGNYARYHALPYDQNLDGGIENVLYKNNGDNTFEEVGVATGVNDPDGATLGVMFTDFDGDQDPDLYVANDFGYFYAPNTFLRNEYPEDVFTDIGNAAAVDTAINAMGLAVGDYDEDGDLDYYVTNIKGNSLFENLGDGFAEVATFKAVNIHFSTSWGTAFVDYDNDTYLDLIVANGRVMPSYNLHDPDHVQRLMKPHANVLFHNNGSGSFADVSVREGFADTTRCRGLAYADYDNDGDLDFAVVALTPNEKEVRSLLYRNQKGAAKNWLKVSLQGTASNRDGIGSRVRVVADGRSWIREIDGGTSYVSQHSSIAHFGLGDIAAVDSVIVMWPGGNREAFADIEANQTLHIVENTSISYPERSRTSSRSPTNQPGETDRGGESGQPAQPRRRDS